MINVLGYAASSAVLATFLMRTMLPLRVVAILSNVLFVTYGYLAHIEPVLFLHVALLPINLARLVTLRDCTAAARSPLPWPAPGFDAVAQWFGRAARDLAQCGLDHEHNREPRDGGCGAFDPRLIHGR
jgi:hypothetical protein